MSRWVRDRDWPRRNGGVLASIWRRRRCPALLQDQNTTNIGISGWLRYVIVRSAKYALNKEEGTDASHLDAELIFLKKRIEEAAQYMRVATGGPFSIAFSKKVSILLSSYKQDLCRASYIW